MRVKPRTLIVLAACAALIAAGVILLSVSEKPAKLQPLEVALVNIKPKRIEVVNAQGGYTLVGHEKGYEMAELIGRRLNEGMAEQLFYALAGLKSQSAAPLGDAGGYGLERPQARARIIGENGEAVTLKIGRKTALESYYCESTAAEGVYLIEPYFAELLMNGADAYQNKMLIDFIYDSDYDYLEWLGFSGKMAAPIRFGKTPDGFALTEPVEWPCVQSELINQYFNNILHLSADTYAGKTQSSEMGFDDPDYTIEMLYRGETFALLFGRELGDMRYVKRSDSDDVYLVSAKKLDFLRLDIRTAVGSALYHRPVSDVASISVFADGVNLGFDVIKNGERYTTVINGEPASFMPMYDALLDLPPLNRIDSPGSGGAVRIALTLHDGREDVLELARLNEREYGVSLNGVCEFSTYAANVGVLLERIEAIAK